MGTENPKKPGKTQGDVSVLDRSKAERPPKYKVLLHNDDYTTMEFVIEVLGEYFEKTRTEATRIMPHVHHHGLGVAGIYPFEIAETKVHQVTEHARVCEHPLLVTMEKE